MKIELDLRDIHATMSQHEKEDQSRTKMIPNEKWTKTFDCSDMEEQLELLSKQDGGVSNNDNPVDEESIVENVTREELTRSCNECNKKFKWMAELIKHMLSEHKPIDAGETDPMWYMLGELLAEVRDEQVLMREENEDFSRGMLQAMKLLTQTLTQDLTKNIQRMFASQLKTDKSQVFVCDVCSYESETKGSLKMHVHCIDCNILLASMDELSRHKRTVHKDKPEEEEDLKKKVMEMETLQIEVDNMKSLFKEQSQELLLKNAIIESYKDVEKQKVQTKIPVVSVQNKGAEPPKMDKVDEHRCNACDKLFRTNKDLDNHVQAKHKEVPAGVSYHCKICSNEFNTKKDIETHKKSCMQHICLTCGEIFNASTELQKHKGECAVIDNLHYFPCDPCKVVFQSHNDIMEHMSQIHLTEAQRTGQGLAKYNNDKMTSNKEWRPPLCRNGAKCYYHRQDRCQFFHHQPPQRQQVRHHRQAPSDQWKQVLTRRPQVQNKEHNQQTHEQQPQGHKYWSVPPMSDSSTPWCLHGRGCPMGRYGVLRHEDSDFPNGQSQGSN